MNKKAQMQVMGVLIVAFVAVIVGLALFNGGITSNVASVTQTQSVANETLTAGTSNNTVELSGKAVQGSAIILNESNDDVSSQFTVLNNQINDAGELTAELRTDDAQSSGATINATYTYQPLGYITTSGGRSLADLIVVFAALAIAAIGIAIVARNGVFDLFK